MTQSVLCRLNDFVEQTVLATARPFFEQMEAVVAQQGREIAEDFSELERQLEGLQTFVFQKLDRRGERLQSSRKPTARS